MPKYTNLKHNPGPLGGRPKNQLWLQFQEISSIKVRCKKCLSIFPKRIDRVKVHHNKCFSGRNDKPQQHTSEKSESFSVSDSNDTNVGEEIPEKNISKLASVSQTSALSDSDRMNATSTTKIIDFSNDCNESYETDSDKMNATSTTKIIDFSNDCNETIETIAGPSSEMLTWPISSTPVKSIVNLKSSTMSKSIKKQQKGSKNIDEYIHKTSNEKLEKIKEKWADFFYKVNYL